MNTRPRTRATRKQGKPLTDRGKQAGRIVRVHPVFSDWQINPITHYDRATYISAVSDFALPFCRSLAVAAAAGASFGCISISKPLRVMICSVFDKRSVADDLAGITAARGWLPANLIAIAPVVLHWGDLCDDGQIHKLAGATEPQLVIVEAGRQALPLVRSRLGDSDAGILIPTDDPGDDPDSIRLRIERQDENYHLTGDDGVILKMDRDDAGFIPLGTARVIDLRARVSAGKKTIIQEGNEDAK